MFEKLLDYFITTQNPFAILFSFLLIYTIITNVRRETERRNELKEFRESITKDLDVIKENTTLILGVWKLMIERELERRKQE